VQAVVKDAPANSSFRFDVLLPVAARQMVPKEKENELQWGNFYYQTFLKLHPGTDPKKISAKLKSIMDINHKREQETKMGLMPLLWYAL
jgi:putative ABC transport system permease protein